MPRQQCETIEAFAQDIKRYRPRKDFTWSEYFFTDYISKETMALNWLTGANGAKAIATAKKDSKYKNDPAFKNIVDNLYAAREAYLRRRRNAYIVWGLFILGVAITAVDVIFLGGVITIATVFGPKIAAAITGFLTPTLTTVAGVCLGAYFVSTVSNVLQSMINKVPVLANIFKISATNKLADAVHGLIRGQSVILAGNDMWHKTAVEAADKSRAQVTGWWFQRNAAVVAAVIQGCQDIAKIQAASTSDAVVKWRPVGVPPTLTFAPVVPTSTVKGAVSIDPIAGIKLHRLELQVQTATRAVQAATRAAQAAQAKHDQAHKLSEQDKNNTRLARAAGLASTNLQKAKQSFNRASLNLQKAKQSLEDFTRKMQVDDSTMQKPGPSMH